MTDRRVLARRREKFNAGVTRSNVVLFAVWIVCDFEVEVRLSRVVGLCGVVSSDILLYSLCVSFFEISASQPISSVQ